MSNGERMQPDNSSYEPDLCSSLRLYAWRQTYLTENVYKSLVASASINSVTATLAVIFNALVILVVIRKPQVRSNYTILSACLAVPDVMVGLLVLPLVIAADTKRILGVGPFCAIDWTIFIIVVLMGGTSANHLTLVSVERYVAIKYPLQYEELVTNQRLKTGILFVWILSLLETSPYICQAIIDAQDFIVAMNIAFTIVSFLTLSIIMYANIYIFSETRRQKRRIQAEQVTHQEAERLKREGKAGRTLMTILLVLVVSYLPIILTTAFSAYIEHRFGLRILYVMIGWGTNFAMLPSLLNPIIYCVRLKKLRRAMLRMLSFRQTAIGPDIDAMGFHHQLQPAN